MVFHECSLWRTTKVLGGERRRGGTWNVQGQGNYEARPPQIGGRLPSSGKGHGGQGCIHLHQRRVLQRSQQLERCHPGGIQGRVARQRRLWERVRFRRVRAQGSRRIHLRGGNCPNRVVGG